MIGQHKRDFTLVPYQSEWKGLFELEDEQLRRVLGEKALLIEHVGSTSIPGMAAKAIIDIMVAVESLIEAVEWIPDLEALGYDYRSHDTIPERMFFARELKPEFRTHHLNLTELGSGFWVNQLAFRDYLRAHEQLAAEYVDLKQRLAEEYARTRQLDREWKTAFVTRVLALAAEEESGSG